MTESRKVREFKQREQEILHTATHLFNEQGLDKVTVADIAKATDIGKGTIYKHFVSKDAMLARIANDFSRDVLTQIQTIDTALSSEQQMRAMFEISFNAHIKLPLISEIGRLYMQPSFLERLPQEYQTACLDIEHAYFAVLNRICEQGKQNNELPDLPVDEIILGAHATFIGALEMLKNQRLHSFTEAPQLSQSYFINTIINFTMAGIYGHHTQSDAKQEDTHE